MEKHFNTIKDTFVIQNGIKVYNFNWCLNYIEYQGKLIYGRYFKIEAIDHQTILKLVIYAIRDEKNNRYLVIEGFCYNPSMAKRDIMHELESIIKSVKLL